MTTAANFAEILNRPAKEVKAPPVLPAGPYMGIIQGQYKQIESSKKTPGVQFTIALQQPVGDVDQEALQAIGGIAGKQVNHTIYVSEGSAFYLKKFLVDHVGLEEGDRSLSELLAETPGKTVGVTIKNQPSREGDRMVHFVGDTFKI